MENKKSFADNPIIRAVGLQKIVVIAVLIILVAFFSVANPAFRQYSTLLSIMDYTYYLAFLGMGVTFCLISGGNDLSIGTGTVAYALIGGYAITHWGVPVIVGIIITMCLGILMGTINGLIVAKGGHAPFLATLCTMMIVRGMGSIIANGMSVSWPPANAANGWTRALFKITIGGTKYPLGFVWVLLLAIILNTVLNKTKIGRYIIAIGSNKEATRLSGVNVVKYTMAAYIISGICTGLSALAYCSAFQSLAPGTGAGFEMNAIGGAIIGGTSMTGGAGTIAGTILGVFIISVLQTGLPFIGLQANMQQIIIGCVLLLAVYIDVQKNKRLAAK